jgi:hypothetical protein
MNRISKTTCLLLLATGLGLSACGRNTSTDPQATIAYVYTAAAQTANAAIQAGLQTAAAAATNTPAMTPTPSLTLTAQPTSLLPGLATATTNSCDNATYVSDVTFPDNTVIAPSTSFNKIWTIKNIGTCTWSTGYSLTFVSGSQMSGAATTISSSVPPGGSIQIAVAMVSPSADGAYTGYWRMMNASGVKFGGTVTVVIKVSSGVTSTPTATGTAGTVTATATSEQTATPSLTPTESLVPSETPTPDPSATSRS